MGSAFPEGIQEAKIVLSISLITVVAATHQMTAWESFVAIISKPDNMPVAGALALVLLSTWIAFRQARHNDKLIAEGRRDEILSDMRKP